MVVDNDKKLDPTDKVYKFNDTVKFKVAYPKDYAKKKHHKDGDVIDLHVIQAEDWEARGLGKIVK
jgi:hypothetical protein